MVSRKEDQGNLAISKIQEATKGTADVEWIHCDMGDLAQVKQVADTIREKEQRLDIVCRRLKIPVQYSLIDETY